MSVGVYAIRHKESRKVYVGSAAQSIRARWTLHRSRLRRGVHPNIYLQAAWTKHGELAFEFVVLEECSTEQCVSREQTWIDRLHAADRRFGYNMNPTAGSSLGRRLSEEHKAKIGRAHRGMKRPPETGEKISAANKGRKPTAATRKKMRDAKLGIKRGHYKHRKNLMSMPRHRDNTSGHKGVYWNKRAKRWMSQIHHRRTYFLGYFDTKEDASKCYQEAHAKLCAGIAPKRA